MNGEMNHDVIVIGASAGGLEVLLGMVERLPAEMPASLFIASHVAPGYRSELPALLSTHGPLQATHPLHEEKIARGHIYVAPPDNHLILREGFVQVVRGPRENGHRPAADALFRSASVAYAARVIGVVLSGYGDCGTAGMMSIKARGGICVAQSPESAVAPDMPRSAIERAGVDHVVTPDKLPLLLTRLAASPAAPARPLALAPAIDLLEGRKRGTLAELACPTCQGVLTEARTSNFEQFRCHVGHTFTLDSLVREQDEEMERALWAAVRALEESAALGRRMSTHAAGELKRRYEETGQTQRQQADLIRGMLLSAAGSFEPEKEAESE